MNASECIVIIKEKYPHLFIEDYSWINQGENNDILIVNNQLIFRFPKYQRGIEDLKQEAEVLTEIQKYITLPIPKPQFQCFDDLLVGKVFIGYSLIPGEPLSREIFFKTKEKYVFADQLGGFLSELHNIPLTKLSTNLRRMYSHGYWQKMLTDCQEKLFPYMRLESKNQINERFKSFLSDTSNFKYTPVVIHGDFGPTNILFDKQLQKVSGVIDFSSVNIGDPAIDFASLIGPFGYGVNFLKTISQVYPEVVSMIARAKFYASTFGIQEALFGVLNNDRKAFLRGISSYQ